MPRRRPALLLGRGGRPISAVVDASVLVSAFPNDDHVIATALAVNAGFIVTGDKDLLALGQCKTVRILTARDFLAELES
jgi:hypothetical protein